MQSNIKEFKNFRISLLYGRRYCEEVDKSVSIDEITFQTQRITSEQARKQTKAAVFFPVGKSIEFTSDKRSFDGAFLMGTSSVIKTALGPFEKVASLIKVDCKNSTFSE